jgi:hypothetical protein
VEEHARQEVEEQARQEAEEQARQEVEEQARQETEEHARQEVEEQARQEAEMDGDEGDEVTDSCDFCHLRIGEINRLLEENRKLKKELENLRFNENFLEDDSKVKYYTGLPSLATFLVLLKWLSPMLNRERRVLSPFQMLLVTFMRLRLNLPRIHIGHLLRVSPTTVGNMFYETIQAMFVKIGGFVQWPDRDTLHTSMPHQFVETFGKNVAVIIDCFEIFIERPSNLKARAQTFSNYKHNHTIKYLIGIAPQGAITFISKGWGGRTTDKHVTENDGFLINLVPGDIVLADRGFDIKDSVLMMNADVKIPIKTTGRAQLDAKDIEETRSLAHLRIHVERVIGNLCNKYEILTGTIPISLILPCENENVTFLDKIES